MQVNGYKVIDRHNRAGVLQPVGLRVFFINDGVFQDPYEISGVTIFDSSANMSPSSVLDSSTNLIASSDAVSSLVKMHFANSDVAISSPEFNETNYVPGNTASGIYRLGTGEYIVILDGSVDLSGNYSFHTTTSGVVANTANVATDYIDVWTIRQVEGSKLKSVITNFKLYDDTFFVVTQPLLLTPKSSLITKKVNLGSKVDLEISNEISIGNRDIDASIKNIFRDSVITSASFEIVKLNDESNLPSRVTVSSFSETYPLIDVTADNTLVYNWNTGNLRFHPAVVDGTFGAMTGNYTVQAKFNLLKETYLSDRFYFTIE